MTKVIGVRSTMSEMVASVRSAQREMVANIEALRQKVDELKQERQSILDLPVTAEFACQRVDDWVDYRISRTQSLMQHAPNSGKWNDPPETEEFLRSPVRWQGLNARGNGRESDLLLTMAVFLKDQISSAIKAQVLSHYASSLTGISEEERSERLTEIDQRILDAEMCEEGIIRESERAGFKVVRRKDADPRAVLASEISLP